MNYVLTTAGQAQSRFTAFMLNECGYITKTTFYMDFTIADAYGVDAIRDTYNRSFKAYQNDKVYITELCLVLNHKIWEHHSKNNEPLMVAYDTLWKQLDNWIMTHLSDEDLEYYLQVTD